MENWPILVAILIVIFCWWLSGKLKKQAFRKYLIIPVAIIAVSCSTVIHLPPQPVYGFEHDSIAHNILDFYHVCNKISVDYSDVNLYDFSDKSFDLEVKLIESPYLKGGIREVWKFAIKDTTGRCFTIEDWYDHKLDLSTNINNRINGVKSRIKNPGR